MRSLSQIAGELEAKRNAAKRELTRLDAAIGALRGTNKLDGLSTTKAASPKLRRTMSAAARKKIATAQKARWAAWKAKQKKAA